MKRQLLVNTAVIATLLTVPTLTLRVSAQENSIGSNIALGKKVTAVPAPNSGDTGNKLELLTDGNPAVPPVVSQGSTSMWVQPNAVSWARAPIACLTVDLGSVQPISGFSYHTAAGVADVSWPNALYILVSDDMKNWKYAGNLVELSAKHSTPPARGTYHEHTFSTRDLQTSGRYVTFGITTTIYTVTDEVEVFAGDKDWLPQNDTSIRFPGQPEDLFQFIRLLTVRDRVHERIAADGQTIIDAIRKSSLATPKQRALVAKAEAALVVKPTDSLPGMDFKAIMPISDAHRAVLAVQGEFLSAQGYAPVTVWNQQRFEWLDLVGAPRTDRKASVDFSMLRDQVRSQSLLLTNASAKEQQVKIQLNGAPKGAKAGWLQVDEVLWTDTFVGTPVPDALKPAPQADGIYTITVPAGMTRKVWLTLDSSKVPSGLYQSTLAVHAGAVTTKVPFNCNISKLAMKRPRISLGMWDETNGIDKRSSYGLNAKNYPAAMKLMHSHYVDTAWGKRDALPWPGADEFDAQGQLIGELDFTPFDNWVKDWPDGRYFFVFLNAGDNFAGEKVGTPLFDAKVKSWAGAVVAHVKKVGRDPGTVGLLLVDEPYTDAADAIIVAWSNVINAAAPELQLFSDPLWLKPEEMKHPEAFTNMDILSPNLQVYKRGGASAAKYFENLRQQGKQLWFYQCDGPARLFDPQRYYRYQAWHTFSIGGTGQGFWAFGDGGEAPWNEYLSIRFTYAPAFVDKETVTNSVHWDSVREGMEDFEELAMLRDAIAASKDAKLRLEGQRVLDEAVRSVTGIWKDDVQEGVQVDVTRRYDWRRTDFDPHIADRALTRVRRMLEQFH